MLSMQVFNQTELNHDGAVLQYSIDGGSWINVGVVDQGINWYNSYDVSAEPGGKAQGWSGTDSLNWFTAKHDLDVLKGKSNVRFRIAFAADAGGNYDGFGVDDIYIGNRTRRVLIEHFTNTQSSSSTNADEKVNNLVDRFPTDVIDIQYHTGYPVGDNFYTTYPMGTAARENYYGLSSSPSAMIEGTKLFTFTGLSVPDSTIIKTLSLSDPEFDITLDVKKSSTTLNISTTIKALSAISDRQLILYTAVVEKAVNKVVSSKTIEFQNVLRKMLPVPGGQYINTSWTANQAAQYSISYEAVTGVNIAHLNVVSFIQDELTGEILQTATSDTTAVATSIDDLFTGNEGFSMLAYPNPARDNFAILLSQPLKEAGQLLLYDQHGALIKTIDLNLNDQYRNIEVSELPQGVYFIHCRANGAEVVQKLVIMH